ncbi:hypothetical protein OAF54_01035 [bacterium]|nr:hypothetical protein [bacterium]
MMSKMKIWKGVEKTDPNSTKEINFGRKFTAIDAYSQIKAATEQFGPVGEGWGWEVHNVQYPPNDTVVVHLKVWHTERLFMYDVFGQKNLNNTKGKPDEDAFKKALTDAITKGLSYLGFNADVFLGRFEDNKYVAELKQEAAQKASREHPDVKGNVTKAKEMFNDWCRNLAACDDDSSLDAFVVGSKNMCDRFRVVIPEWAEGDTGVDARITKRKQEIADE